MRGSSPLPWTYKTLSVHHWTTNPSHHENVQVAIRRIRPVMTDWPQLYIPAIQIWYKKVYCHAFLVHYFEQRNSVYPARNEPPALSDQQKDCGATRDSNPLFILLRKNTSRPIVYQQYPYCTKNINRTLCSRQRRNRKRNHLCILAAIRFVVVNNQTLDKTHISSYNVHITKDKSSGPNWPFTAICCLWYRYRLVLSDVASYS